MNSLHRLMFSMTESTRKVVANRPAAEYRPILMQNTQKALSVTTQSDISSALPTDTPLYVHSIRAIMSVPPEEAPSRRVIASRYVLEPEIFDCLDRTPPGKGGEIQLTDAMRMLLATRPMTGCPIRGIRHDAGNRLDFLKTNIHYALQRPDLREPLLAYLRDIVKG